MFGLDFSEHLKTSTLGCFDVSTITKVRVVQLPCHTGRSADTMLSLRGAGELRLEAHNTADSIGAATLVPDRYTRAAELFPWKC